MGSDNKRKPGKPAIAGEVESFSDVEALDSQIRSEHPPWGLEEAGVTATPDALLADGTAFQISLDPGFTRGKATLYRPFRGVAVMSLSFVALDSSSLHQISKVALPGRGEILVRLFHRGKIRYRFGERVIGSDEVPGIVSFCPGEGQFDYTLIEGEENLVTLIGITEEGEREVWHRMGIPATPLFQKLRDAENPEQSVYPLTDNELFERLNESFLNIPTSGFAHSVVMRLRVAELFCLLSEEIPVESNSISSEVPFSEVKKLSHAKAILEESVASPPSIVELGAMVGLNRRKLTEGFKKVFGDTVAGYGKEQQLRQGYQLLKETKLSIQDIAESCGYEYSHNFTSAFRRRFGCSPSSARKNK